MDTSTSALPELVSVHGGHSGQFCNHAADTLEAVVQTYIRKGFVWVGITEHMPPVQDRFVYPDERQAGLTAALLRQRFERYMAEARRLQQKYSSRIDILVGFETEYYSGSPAFIQALISRFKPDYYVGSIHHLFDIPIDYTVDEYNRALVQAGDKASLYCSYFDAQLRMIEELRPPVVGHFDLIRIFDPDYSRTLRFSQVWTRVERNLNRIAQLNLILDCNAAALRKGAREPYPCAPVLTRARELGISVSPGDDSHGVDTVGAGLSETMLVLEKLGFATQWAKPGRTFA